MWTHQPKRHPNNPKLRLHYENIFNGAPVFQHPSAPLVANYLETTWHVLHDALNAHPRTLAIRLDLRFPTTMPVGPMHADNACLSRFFTALQQELKAARTKYPPALRYVWCREQDTGDKPHYHLLLLLNGNAVSSLGAMEMAMDGYTRRNLYHRCVRAWKHAIGASMWDMRGLVHVGQEPLTHKLAAYRLQRDNTRLVHHVFYCSSYLCKSYSKLTGQGVRGFGSSQVSPPGALSPEDFMVP